MSWASRFLAESLMEQKPLSAFPTFREVYTLSGLFSRTGPWSQRSSLKSSGLFLYSGGLTAKAVYKLILVLILLLLLDENVMVAQVLNDTLQIPQIEIFESCQGNKGEYAYICLNFKGTPEDTIHFINKIVNYFSKQPEQYTDLIDPSYELDNLIT